MTIFDASFYPPFNETIAIMPLNKPKQNLLLTLAWQSIAHGLKTGKPLHIKLTDYPNDLVAPRATFVNLAYRGLPRGNFGNLRPVRPLVEDVSENAFAAAFCDRHYPSVTDMEISDLDIQIDLLSPLERISFSSELDLIKQLTPQSDGLVLEEGSHHAFLMPSRWETLHSPMQFLQQLKRKAGLPAPYWSNTITAFRFTIESIS